MTADAQERRLETEIERLLAAALQRDQEHAADVQRRELHHLDELRRRDADRADLQRALETRDLIGQAKGVIMSSLGCTASEAFELLVKQSQHENRKLIDVATEVASRTQRRK